MLINTIYSLDLEIVRVHGTVDKLRWYREKWYQVTLPKDLELDTVDDENIRYSVLHEYNPQVYQEVASRIESELRGRNIGDQIWDIFWKLKIPTPPVIEIQLTRYWTKGSYNPPACIILHIEQKRPLISIIFHEMIHLAIHPYIEMYNISHWHKEALVDFLFEEILPEISFRQPLKESYINDIKAVFFEKRNICHDFPALIKRLSDMDKDAEGLFRTDENGTISIVEDGNARDRIIGWLRQAGLIDQLTDSDTGVIIEERMKEGFEENNNEDEGWEGEGNNENQ